MHRQQRCWWCPLHSHLPFLLSSPQATLVPTNCSAKSPTPSLAPNRQAICCPHFLDTLLFLDFLIPQSSDVLHHPGYSWSVSRLLRDSTSKSRRAPRSHSTHLLSVLCVTCMSGWYNLRTSLLPQRLLPKSTRGQLLPGPGRSPGHAP